MSFDIRSFAEQVRPSPKKPSPESFNDSVFDAGSPQYVRPEDLFLDIQARLFGLKPLRMQDLSGLDPSDFKSRWLREGSPMVSLNTVGTITREQLVRAVMSLLRCPQRKKERFPTLLPVVPTLSSYKNIKANLPNFFNDQFRPALLFADDVQFSNRILQLRSKLYNGTPADNLKQLASALLPPVEAHGQIDANADLPTPHKGPLLRNYSITPSTALPVCESFQNVVDALVSMESQLPRVLWIRWLTAVVRVWLPLFFLKRCGVTSAAANAIKSALSQGSVSSSATLTDTLIGKAGILRGSRDWINQLAPIIQNYVRGRFELSILLELCNLCQRLFNNDRDPTDAKQESVIRKELDAFEVKPRQAINPLPPAVAPFASVKLSMPNDGGDGRLSFNEWLGWAVEQRASLDALARIIGATNTLDLVEKVYGHIRPNYEPLKSGFGKNALEYVGFALGAPRKVDRNPDSPDEFNVIYRAEGGRRARQITVQPGPELLTLVVQLVTFQSRQTLQASAKLSELLDLFEATGIDFRSNPDDFEGLKAELLRLGLLQSSADAAEAASLNPRYSF